MVVTAIPPPSPRSSHYHAPLQVTASPTYTTCISESGHREGLCKYAHCALSQSIVLDGLPHLPLLILIFYDHPHQYKYLW